jgi:cold shock protein
VERGIVKAWDRQRAFGFIKPDGGGPDVFCHVTSVVNREPLERGATVEFLVEQVRDGRYRAREVMPVFEGKQRKGVPCQR